MKLITIQQARDHCKATAAEDAMLTLYGDAAEAACSRRTGRNFYADQAELDAARDGMSAAMAAAVTAHTDALAAADLLATTEEQEFARTVADDALLLAQIEQGKILYGMVAPDDIIAAVLLLTSHFYVNREEVSTGSNAGAVPIPFAAASIIDRYYVVWPL